MSVPPDHVDTVNRRFQTRDDRAANAGREPGQPRQRSMSIERRYRSGSIDRIHVHNNVQNGNPQFSHVIGHTDRNGNYNGR